MSELESLSAKQHVPRAEDTLATVSVASLSPPIAPVSLAHAAMLVVLLMLIGALYWGTIAQLIKVWDEDPNYSHGFVVPFFALGLAWIAYQRHGVLPVGGEVMRASLIWGTLEIAAGFALHLVAIFLGKLGLFLDVAALIFMLRGTVLALGGPAANAAYGFPLLFLIFMAPIPAQVYEPIALRMQSLASIVAAGLLEIVGVPVLREGYVIHIPGHTLEVAGECSGMRSLTAILALAMAIGYISGRGQGYRWALGLLSAPVAIGVNCVRVFGTGLIMLYFGREWATGAAHQREGEIMVGIAALLLVALAWLLAKIEDTYFKKPQLPAPANPPPEAAAADPYAPA